MPIEKAPLKPLPKDFVPESSISYPVVDGDDWYKVAAKFTVDVQKLIYFNFHTNNPDEVNWYLKRNVGCYLTDERKLNYKFSSNLIPGKIYIPVLKLDMSPSKVEGRSKVSPLATEYDEPDSPLDKVGKVFDVVGAIDTGLTIAEIGLLDVVMIPVGGIVSAVGPLVALGGAHEAALNNIRNGLMKEGLSLGLVLAADQQLKLRPNFVRRFIKYGPIPNINYPEYSKQFQGIFNTAFVAGLAHGKKFNTVAQANLFHDLRNKMTDYAKDLYEPHLDDKEHPDHYSKWDDNKWENFYRLCARIYAQHHLKGR
jgi:hypothetical protein